MLHSNTVDEESAGFLAVTRALEALETKLTDPKGVQRLIRTRTRRVNCKSRLS